MSHYTTEQLNALSVKEIKAICVELGLAPAFRKAACIEQILDYQDAQEVPDWEKEAIAAEADLKIAATCATCPHFQQYPGEQRGLCCKFDMVSRSHWEKTQDCKDEVVEEVPATAPTVEPQPIVDNEDGSFQVLSSDRTHYYRVQGDRCTCTAGSFGNPCRHVREVAEYTTTMQSQELEAYIENQHSGVALLTAPQAIASPSTYRYMVELASDRLDRDGVPLEFKTIDVLVTEPTEEAINLLLQSANWLEGFTMVDYWQPDGCIEF
jgi:hypothetical protein